MNDSDHCNDVDDNLRVPCLRRGPLLPVADGPVRPGPL